MNTLQKEFTCVATTKSGSRCKRPMAGPDERCFQHLLPVEPPTMEQKNAGIVEAPGSNSLGREPIEPPLTPPEGPPKEVELDDEEKELCDAFWKTAKVVSKRRKD